MLALLVAAAVGTGAWYFGYARYTTTPAVLQLSPEEAQERLEAAGLDVKTGEPEYSDTVDAGLVLSTDPSAGKRVLKGTDVTITVSLGRAVAQLPKLTGITVDEAQDRILNANMAFGEATDKYSETVPEGIVIASDPKGGTSQRFGTIVDLVVSKGRRPIPVGSWVGKSADDAEQALKKRGLKVDVSQQYSDSVAAGVVISQDPKTGTLFKNDTVQLARLPGPGAGRRSRTWSRTASTTPPRPSRPPASSSPSRRARATSASATSSHGPRSRHRPADRLDGHHLPGVTTATTRRNSLLATGALLLTTASWGSTFFLIKDLLDRVPTLDFLAVRFAIAGVVMLVVMHRAVLALDRQAWRRAGVLGLVYGVAQILQTPGWRTRRRACPASSPACTSSARRCWPASPPVADHGAHVGCGGAGDGGAGRADPRRILRGVRRGADLRGRVLYALHIVALGAWSTAKDALGLSVVQLLVIAVVCLLATAPDGVVLPETRHDWLAVVYMALVAGALALVAQTWAQSQLSPTRTAIIMSMEPVFAAFFAVLLGGEGVTSRMLLGGALVLAAMLLVEAGPRRKVEGEVQHLTV